MVTLLERNRVSLPEIYTKAKLQGYLKQHFTVKTQATQLDSERYLHFSYFITTKPLHVCHRLHHDTCKVTLIQTNVEIEQYIPNLHVPQYVAPFHWFIL